MSGLPSLLVMSGLLGAACFGVALLPLSYNFSRLSINRLSNLGTGLLIGAALGVILPEGVEAIMGEESSPSSSHQAKVQDVPTSSIALALLMGFSFMLAVEQMISHQHSHSHSSSRHNAYNLGPLTPTSVVTNDPELDFDLNLPTTGFGAAENRTIVALPLTLGLVVHALADGFALGASALTSSAGESSRSNGPSELSLVVFFALLVHKAPAALALSTSLLATSLPRSEIRKHLAVFASSTPIGAVVTYFALQILAPSSSGGWTGFALLFSAGTFLYVATVLQPISSHSSVSADEPGTIGKLVIVVVGMYLPFAIGAFIGHGHQHTGEPQIPGGVVISDR